jgi:Ca-activated chloride channel family protein
MKFDFTHPHFAEPLWLWVALLGPPALVLLQLHARRARRRELARLAAPAALAVMLQSHSPARRLLKYVLRVVLVFSLGVALARPQWGEQTEKSESLGEDVVFLLDCSLSMLSADVAPSRVARAKLAIQEFAQNYGRGRVGLVAFAGQAFLQCPLTFDNDAFGDALQAVDEHTIPVPGTDIGRALQEGYSAVAKNGRRKILVLVSDGEDLEKGSVAAAKSLAAKNVIIFTVGVGTAAGSEIFVPTPDGGREKLLNAQDQPVLSRLDEPTLREIAETTHGTYLPLGALGDGLDRVRQALDNTDGLARVVTTRRDGVDHFQVPAALALILLISESLLGTRRPERKRGAPARPPVVAVTVALVLAFSVVRSASGAGNPPELPREPRALFNLGTTNLIAGHWREAETALDAAINSNDQAVQPLALYNRGQVLFRAGRETLKGVPLSAELEARGEHGIDSAGSALKAVNAALAGDDYQAAISAYRSATATITSLKKILEAVKGSSDTCTTVLQRWQRADDDFQSALELRAGYENARTNARLVDQHVVDLTGEQWRLREVQEAVTTARDELQKQLDALKRRLPPEDTKGQQGQNDGSQDPSKSSKPEDQDTKGDSGQEMVLTPAEAMRLLSSLHLDLSRQYSAGNLPDDAKRNAGRNW